MADEVLNLDKWIQFTMTRFLTLLVFAVICPSCSSSEEVLFIPYQFDGHEFLVLDKSDVYREHLILHNAHDTSLAQEYLINRSNRSYCALEFDSTGLAKRVRTGIDSINTFSAQIEPTGRIISMKGDPYEILFYESQNEFCIGDTAHVGFITNLCE